MTAEPQRPVRSRSRINYKLPSLRKKLRRPDDKLVDAVYYVEQDDLRIVDDIEEPRNKRKRRDSGRFIKISNDFLLDGEPQIKEEDVHNGDINSDCNKLSLPVSQVAVSQETILQEAKSQFPDKTAIDIPQKQTRIPLGDISNTSNNNSNISGNISGNSSHQDSNDSSIVKQEDAKIIHKKSSLSEGMSAFDFMEDEQEDLLKCNRRKTIFSNNSNSISSNDEGNKVPITMNDDERKKVNKKMRSSNIQKKKNNNNKRRYSNVY
ncbi:hypothetical protein PACTADRAFT_31583 [Pachysolen tannophilus NRRL Y-2460]|uniref:Uncharacterized protein n=1 Tax=Pachysolen tannophilus NRRL Y-2460 TaxID=669874 RepID=A0A1E4U2F6_PACTA|nr:hypothetical protein PACTADRAFT_31583 [Pachysolen tannophilus NRRL Y-2460]